MTGVSMTVTGKDDVASNEAAEIIWLEGRAATGDYTDSAARHAWRGRLALSWNSHGQRLRAGGPLVWMAKE